jgi:hypothetical protein
LPKIENSCFKVILISSFWLLSLTLQPFLVTGEFSL